MEAPRRKFKQTGKEGSKHGIEQPLPKQTRRKLPVVYYLSRNHQLEHPHFVEVPLTSSEGLYLRDVLCRLNTLRGKALPAKYSWSCKRSYKNGFIWQDLCDDDLIYPSNGNEYVLKGSEICDDSPQDQLDLKSGFSKGSSGRIHDYEALSLSNSGRKDGNHYTEVESVDATNHLSLSTNEARVFRPDSTVDSSTQTDENEKQALIFETCTKGVSTDEDQPIHQNLMEDNTQTTKDWICPSQSPSGIPSSGKTDTLESLIIAEARKYRSFRTHEEKGADNLSKSRIKAPNVLMQLLSCGSFSVKSHHNIALVPSYKPRFFHAKFPPQFSSMGPGEDVDLPQGAVITRSRLREKEYFNENMDSLNKLEGKRSTTLEESYKKNSNREKNTTADKMNHFSGSINGLPRHQIDSYHEKSKFKAFNGKEKMIEERLTSGALVVIRSCSDKE